MVRRSLAALACALLLANGCGRPAQRLAEETDPAGAASEAAAGVSDRLAAIVEDWFEAYLALNPTFATAIGDHRYDDRFENWIGAEYREASARLNREYLALASGLDREALDPAGRMTLDMFVRRLELSLERLRFPRHLLPFDQFNSEPDDFAMMGSGRGSHPFVTVSDYENFLSRIDDFLVWVDTAIANMEEGIETGVVQPRLIVERMIPPLRAHVVAAADWSVFYDPVRNFSPEVPLGERERLERVYREAIEAKIIPAYRRLADYLEAKYLPAARDSIGYDDLPGGAAWYDFLVAYHTTTAIPAEEIHQRGLGEVDGLRRQMAPVMARVGFDGELEDFFVHLKTNPEFFWDSPDAVLADYRSVRQRVDAGMPRLFGLTPRAGFEIRPVPEFRAASAAAASYLAPSADGSRPGVFYLNVSNPGMLARWGMETLFLHEAIPGHHFQSALAQESEALPKFRRFLSITAYTEGWALYSEDLGPELGMFQDPYQWFGKLNDEMLRAMRLVVDTGLHRYDWSREQAIDYMRRNSSLPEPEIVTEVERYIVNPGQALAYKTGQLTLRRLRSEAEDALGDSFDLRAWHDFVLSLGEVPMDVLTEASRAWVTSRQ